MLNHTSYSDSFRIGELFLKPSCVQKCFRFLCFHAFLVLESHIGTPAVSVMALRHQIVMLSACLMSLAAADNYGRVSRIRVICCMPTANECFRGTVILVLNCGVQRLSDALPTVRCRSYWFAATGPAAAQNQHGTAQIYLAWND
jgi:hypothetical protein